MRGRTKTVSARETVSAKAVAPKAAPLKKKSAPAKGRAHKASSPEEGPPALTARQLAARKAVETRRRNKEAASAAAANESAHLSVSSGPKEAAEPKEMHEAEVQPIQERDTAVKGADQGPGAKKGAARGKGRATGKRKKGVAADEADATAAGDVGGPPDKLAKPAIDGAAADVAAAKPSPPPAEAAALEEQSTDEAAAAAQHIKAAVDAATDAQRLKAAVEGQEVPAEQVPEPPSPPPQRGQSPVTQLQPTVEEPSSPVLQPEQEPAGSAGQMAGVTTSKAGAQLPQRSVTLSPRLRHIDGAASAGAAEPAAEEPPAAAAAENELPAKEPPTAAAVATAAEPAVPVGAAAAAGGDVEMPEGLSQVPEGVTTTAPAAGEAVAGLDTGMAQAEEQGRGILASEAARQAEQESGREEPLLSQHPEPLLTQRLEPMAVAPEELASDGGGSSAVAGVPPGGAVPVAPAFVEPSQMLT